MVKKISALFDRRNSLKSATGLLAVTLLLSNILGLLRNVVLASNFSPEELDIYYSGFQLPNLVFNLLVFGAVTTAFVPVLSELIIEKKVQKSWQLTSDIFILTTLILVLISLILAIFMPAIIKVIVPGFDPEQMAEAVVISRIMFIQAIIFGWSYIIGGVLNVYKRFTAYALAPLFYNIAIITGAAFGSKIGIIGLAWSVVIGAALHLLIQVPSLWKIGFRPALSGKVLNDYSKRIFRLMIPRSLSLGLAQLNLVVFTVLASTMTGGAIAILNLTNDFQTAPVVIFANAIAIALFPTLADLANQKDWQSFNQLITKALRLTILCLIPSAFIMYILRAQIMRLYVGLGKGFDWEATKMAINTLAYFSLGIVPSGIVAIYSRIFYALKNTKLPMFIAAISTIIGIFAANFLTFLSVGGLALAFSISSFINAILLMLAYKISYSQSLQSILIFKTALVSFITSTIMAAVIWWTLQLVDLFYYLDKIPSSTREVLGLLFQTVAALFFGLIIFLLLTFFYQREEIEVFFKKRIFKKT